jgi:hypothetical protein
VSKGRRQSAVASAAQRAQASQQRAQQEAEQRRQAAAAAGPGGLANGVSSMQAGSGGGALGWLYKLACLHAVLPPHGAAPAVHRGPKQCA